MSSSPGDVYITLDLPPASPSEYIHVAEASSPVKMYTPTRHVRNVKRGGKKRKRPRSDVEDYPNNREPDLASLDFNFPLVTKDVDATDPEPGPGNEPENEQTVRDSPNVRSRPAEGRDARRATTAGMSPAAASEEYAVFVDAVLADELSFYQVSKSFFVVNGWDRKLRCSTVSQPTLR